jgi:Arc/MetJ-type ribon-helix-helix transcriptional regulator
MCYTRTDYYETIIQRQIRAGRASNKSEVIHQALSRFMPDGHQICR